MAHFAEFRGCLDRSIRTGLDIQPGGFTGGYPILQLMAVLTGNPYPIFLRDEIHRFYLAGFWIEWEFTGDAIGGCPRI
jgi:hypothetical protein